jgi:acyl-CoA thioester hydrolase
MARVRLDSPKKFHFNTEIAVRITDLNYGGHMGNDALLSLMHEARVQFLKNYGYTELNVEGVGLIMADAVIQYRSEVFAGDVLKFEITALDFTLTNFDIFYFISRMGDSRCVALAKTNMACFDYSNRKIVQVPSNFFHLFH